MRTMIGAMAAMFVAGMAGAAAPLPPEGRTAAPDYVRAADWLCRPGRADACETDLSARSFDRAGRQAAVPFAAAANPPIDCFYVYPTVSNDPSLYSDLTPAAGEEERAVRAQAARFRSVCRLYAPLYRSLTLTALKAVSGGATLASPIDRGVNYDDLLGAWRAYLRQDNKGRGVVLIGHSQGAILMKRLIAEEIDGKPAQALLVSALLAGNRDLTVAKGRDRGGSFRDIPFCRSSGQSGCVVAWSSYAEGDSASPRAFGGNGTVAGQVAACVNPASLTGGRAPLDGFVPRPPILPVSEPWIEQVGQFSGECVADGEGAVLRVRVAEGPLAPILGEGLTRARIPGWGLHILDISLVQGDLVKLVATQGRAWEARGKAGRR